MLAMFRGENEGFLKVNIAPAETKAIENIGGAFSLQSKNESSEEIDIAIKDSYKRLLSPSLETEIEADI